MNASIDKERHLRELMRAAQAGDEACYAGLLREISPILRRAERRERGFLQSSDVEDLVQDILLSVHEARQTYDPGRPFLPWMIAIARHRMVDGARCYLSRTAHEVAVERPPETFSGADPNTPGEVYGDHDTLRLAVKALPHGQRKAVEMLKLQEMSLKEAAAFGGMTIAALKGAVHRGLNTLRKTLARKD